MSNNYTLDQNTTSETIKTSSIVSPTILIDKDSVFGGASIEVYGLFEGVTVQFEETISETTDSAGFTITGRYSSIQVKAVNTTATTSIKLAITNGE